MSFGFKQLTTYISYTSLWMHKNWWNFFHIKGCSVCWRFWRIYFWDIWCSGHDSSTIPTLCIRFILRICSIELHESLFSDLIFYLTCVSLAIYAIATYIYMYAYENYGRMQVFTEPWYTSFVFTIAPTMISTRLSGMTIFYS